MKQIYLKNIALSLAISSLLACNTTTNVDEKNKNLRDTQLRVKPSLLNSGYPLTDTSNVDEIETNKKTALQVTSIPDLGGINKLIETAKKAPVLEGEPVTFVADQLDVKEFSHKVFNEILGINYVLAPELAASKTNLTLNISTPITRSDFYNSVAEILTQNKITSYRKDDILYLAKISANNKKNDIAIGIGPETTDVPDISGQITHIVPYTYSESRNITSIMKKLSTARVTVSSAQKLIVLEGEREEIIRALKIINMLDVPRAFGRKIRLYEFANIGPEEAIEQIKNLLIEDGFSMSSQGDISFVPMSRINSFVAYAASEEVIDRINFWANKLDVPLAGDEKQYFVYKPKYAKAENMEKALSSLLTGASAQSTSVNNKNKSGSSQRGQGIKFSLDEQQNALIFNVTPIEYKKILSLLEKIDVLPGQVILDVTILEITLKDDMKSGVDWVYDQAGFEKGKAKVDFLSSGSIAGIFSTGEWQMKMNLSEEQDDARVLSRPYLIVRDGESASITSGDQIPIITQVVEDTGNDGSVSNSVQYRSTGVNVSLTPTINSNGVITLSVSMSVSSSKASANTQVETPTITNRAITTEIISRNGQTVALGGLIQENKNDVSNSVPLLGDLPILGGLFSSKTDTFTRSELVMLITTRIVRDSNQVDEFSEAMAELYSAPIIIK